MAGYYAVSAVFLFCIAFQIELLFLPRKPPDYAEKGLHVRTGQDRNLPLTLTSTKYYRTNSLHNGLLASKAIPPLSDK